GGVGGRGHPPHPASRLRPASPICYTYSQTDARGARCALRWRGCSRGPSEPDLGHTSEGTASKTSDFAHRRPSGDGALQLKALSHRFPGAAAQPTTAHPRPATVPRVTREVLMTRPAVLTIAGSDS